MRLFPFGLALAALTSIGCAAPLAPAHRAKTGAEDATSEKPSLPGPPGLSATTLLTLAAEDLPFGFAVSDDGVLFAFASEGSIFAHGVRHDEGSKAVSIASANNVSRLSVRALSKGGFLIFWDETVDQNHIFHVMEVDASGTPVGAHRKLPPIAEAALNYADVAVFKDGRSMVLYDVVKEGRTSVFAVPLGDAKGTAGAGETLRLIDGALSWTGTLSDKGLLVASVLPSGPTAEVDRLLGTLAVTMVDPKGQRLFETPILREPTAEIDVEVAAIKGGFVAAWTDHSSEESAVRMTVVDESGKVSLSPKWIAPPIGRQVLMGLTGSPDHDRALLLWENIGQTSGSSRIVQMASTTLDGTLSKARTRMLLDETDRPDFVVDGSGFAALTLAPAFEKDHPETANSWPSMVRFDADLDVIWSEPVRFANAKSKEGVPERVWGLSCGKIGCFGAAADGGSPAAYYLFGSADRPSVWQPPAWRAEDERPPQIKALRGAEASDRIADLDSVALGKTTAITWVTYYLDGTETEEKAPRGEPPFAASLGVRFTTADGSSLGAPNIISKRAVSIGGVSITAAVDNAKKGANEEVVVLWVAKDKSGDQVFATRIDAEGKKSAQKKVTLVTRNAKGKPASFPFGVSIAGAPATMGKTDGYIATWIDTRESTGQVYAARLGRDLDKTVVDKRISSASDEASDVSVQVFGKDAYFVYASAPKGQPADIHVAHVDAQNLTRIDDPGRVYASVANSRSPKLVRMGSRLILAWIEDGNGKGQPATLRLAEIDRTGKLLGAPHVGSAPDGGSVTDFALQCGDTFRSCRLVLSWATSDGRLEMGAMEVSETGELPAPVRLGALSSGPFATPSFSFPDSSASTLLFSEDLRDRGRMRWVDLGW